MNIIDAIEDKLPVVDSIPSSGFSLAPSRISQEISFWQGKTEAQDEAQPRLSKYWEHLSYANWSPTGTPWSASFISWILRDSGFPGNAAHFRYTQDIAANKADGWKAYSIPKNLSKLTLNPGDVLVRGRGSGNPQSAEYWQTHGDVVWRVTGGEALLVGGNLGNTAKVATRIKVDADGHPIENISGYRVILKKKKGSSVWMIALLAAIGGGLWWRFR